MSPTLTWRRNTDPEREDRRAIAALAVADLESLRLTQDDVTAAVRDCQERHGGPDGVAAELADRMDADTHGTARMLAWATDVIRQVSPQ